MEHQFLDMLFEKGFCHHINLQNAANFTSNIRVSGHIAQLKDIPIKKKKSHFLTSFNLEFPKCI